LTSCPDRDPRHASFSATAADARDTTVIQTSGMTTPMQPDPELLRLLDMAAEQLRCFPNDEIGAPRFANSHDVAEFIEESTRRLREGSVEAGHELLRVFLPTSDWDEAGGTQDIANRLCELLEPYRNTDDRPNQHTESPPRG
jgi:hypothetical protein